MGRQLSQGVRHRRPVSGDVVAADAAAEHDPSRINAYPYARNGLLKVRLDQPRAYEELLSFAAYAEHVRRVSRYDEWTRERRMT